MIKCIMYKAQDWDVLYIRTGPPVVYAFWSFGHMWRTLPWPHHFTDTRKGRFVPIKLA